MITIKEFNPFQDIELLPNLIQCYREVFSEYPWNEWKKCQVCTKNWGKTEFEKSQIKLHCGLELVDFWPESQMIEKILHKNIPETSYWLALEDNKIIGFCWGYPLDINSLAKKYNFSIDPSIYNSFGYFSNLLYLEQIGILTQYRGKKLASKLFAHLSNNFIRLKICGLLTKTTPPPITFLWFRNKLNYQILKEFGDVDGKVILIGNGKCSQF